MKRRFELNSFVVYRTNTLAEVVSDGNRDPIRYFDRLKLLERPERGEGAHSVRLQSRRARRRFRVLHSSTARTLGLSFDL